MKPQKLKLIIVILVLLLGVAMVVTATVLKKNNGNSVDSLSKSVKATTVTDPYGRYAFEIPAGYELVDMRIDPVVLRFFPMKSQSYVAPALEGLQYYTIKHGDQYFLITSRFDVTDSYHDPFLFVCGDDVYEYDVATGGWSRWVNESRGGHEYDTEPRDLLSCDFPTATARSNGFLFTPSADYFNRPTDIYNTKLVKFNSNNEAKAVSLEITDFVFGTWSYHPEYAGLEDMHPDPEPGTTTLAPLLNDYQDLFETIESTIRWLD